MNNIFFNLKLTYLKVDVFGASYMDFNESTDWMCSALFSSGTLGLSLQFCDVPNPADLKKKLLKKGLLALKNVIKLDL